MPAKIVTTTSDIDHTILLSPLTLSSDSPAIEAVRLMSEVRDTCHLASAWPQTDIDFIHHLEKASCILVVENNKVVGIFTERDIVQCTARGLNFEKTTLADIVLKNPVSLKKSEFTNIFVALNLFRQHKIRHLVIVDDQENLIGVVTLTTVRKLLQGADLLKVRTIEDVMSCEVIKALRTTSVLDLARLMATHCVSCVVITESSCEPVGIVTERDIVQIRALDLNILELRAETVMSTPLFFMSPQQSLWEAHLQMQQRYIRRLVVVNDHKKLLGIITQSSILYSLDPLEMYETVNFLQNKVSQLELEKIEILEQQKSELEIQVQQRTSKLIAQANANKILATLSQKIRNSLDIEYILQTTVSEIREYLQTERVIIYEFQTGASGTIVAESLAPDIPSVLGQMISDSCFAESWLQLYINGRVGMINDIYDAGLADCYLKILEQVQIRANLVVPIVYNNELWGLLCAHECSQPRNWQSLEVDLLEKLSSQIAIAIQQSQLYQQAQKELLERQQAENNLKKLNEELENRVAQRTSQLEQINHELLLQIERRIQVEKQLQQLLLELSDFKYALDESAIVAITDTQGIINYVNDNFCKISQYSREELIGNTHKIINSGYHSREFFQELWQTITNGEIWRGEIRNKTKNDVYYWVDATIIPFVDAHGKPWQYLTIRNDITNRKLAESALQESEEKFRQLAENIHEVFWISDPETSQIIYISPAYAEIWGLPCNTVYDNPKSFMDAIYPDDLQEFMIVVKNKKNGFDIEYRIQRPDGSIRWIHDRAFPLKNQNGEVYRIVGIAEDITQRKQAEAEIRKMLQREKELSELKSRFVSMTSHEFRTPLAVISSSAGILKNFGHKLDDEKKTQHLDCIQTYVKHTTQLLDDILLINKAETGNLAFEPSPLELVDFCKKLTEEIQLSTTEHEIIFSSNSLVSIIGNLDKKLLRQILINLVSNAVKYSPKNTTVKFNLNMIKQQAIFSIQDQGIGIPEEDQVKLFESFHRATNVGNIPGTGLGLSIVAKCVDLHKGTIVVNSQVGIGTTFIVKIPLNFHP